MSKYTTEVRYICESLAGLEHSQGYNSVNDVVDSARTQIFDFDYPIFDNDYKPILERKILKHYYTREIGLETYGLWKLKLDTKLNEIMPYYNKLYNSELIEFNPLYDVNITVDHQRVNTDKTTGESSDTYSGSMERTTENEYEAQNGNVYSDQKSETYGSNVTRTNESDGTTWVLNQDTPQNGLTDVEQMNYLSSATKQTEENESSGSDITTGNSSGTGSGTSTDTNSGNGSETENRSDSSESGREFENNFKGIEDYLEHVSGTHGGVSYSKKIMEYRKTFMNIDMMVIDELKSLFMYLW